MYSSAELKDVLSKPMAVMGLGATGRSVLKWLRHRGVPSSAVKVIDDLWTPEKLETLASMGIGEPASLGDPALEEVQTVVVSPGVFPNHPVRVWCRETGRRILNDIQLWAWATESQQAIGITGSNGKSTVTAWTEHIINACGRHAVAVGNIGLPILDVLGEVERGERAPVDAWVMELSSFQLDDCDPLSFVAATILNVSEDHLDYHGSMDDYLRAKARVLKKADCAILPFGHSFIAKLPIDSQKRVTYFGVSSLATWRFAEGQLWYHDQPILNQSALPLLGDHNVLNALVVLALVEAVGIDLTSSQLVSALCNFKGLPHRVERIAQFRGIDFIEDSKGTNVGSTVAALEGLGTRYARLILIAGGDGKGQDFEPLMKPIERFCREVFLIGRDGPRLAESLCRHAVPHRSFERLELAVEAAFSQAQSGEAVVLSPACASWDMFRNYLHRAEVFTNTVLHCIERSS